MWLDCIFFIILKKFRLIFFIILICNIKNKKYYFNIFFNTKNTLKKLFENNLRRNLADEQSLLS
jgi:hypothetical protein